MLDKIHHVNLLVRDLDAAVARYSAVLGVSDWHYGELAGRGVRSARFRAGESWVVLLQPTNPDGVPGQFLAKHGEGLFLLSFGVESLEEALDRIEDSTEDYLSGAVRTGLEGWQVADLSPTAFFNAQLQLTEDD